MKTKRSNGSQSGFAMLVSIGIMLVVGVATTGIYSLVRTEMHMAQRTRDYLVAKVIAEAGANIYYNSIKRDFPAVGFASGVTEYGGGSYDVTLELKGNKRAILKSVGKMGLATAVVSASLLNFEIIQTSTGQAVSPDVLLNAMTSLGSMTLGGNVSVVGDIASATSITTNGKPEINGSGSSPVVSDKHGNIVGGTSDDPSRYTFSWDSFLKLEDYLSHAVTWDRTTPLSSYPDGTILFVPGSIKITESTPLNLCIIATGDISITGKANLTQPGTYPTLVSRDGSIKLAGGASVEGLIAAMSSSGSVQTTGGGNTPVNINGSVITGGDFKDAGNWSINYSPVTLVPPGDSTSNDNVVVVAWKE